VICNLVLALLVSFWSGHLAQAQDSPKESKPAEQDAPQPRVKRIRIGGNLAKSQLKHKVQPIYPFEALDQRLQGTVRLHIVLSTAGKVQQADVIQGHPVLAKAALEAVRKWEYKHTLLNGEAVEVDTTVDVIFSLSQ
jgi:protein TonB